MTPDPRRVATRKKAEMTTEASKSLMKWLSRHVRGAKHIYVVGSAVRNFKLDAPIKDIDMVVDSINLGHDAAWVANQIARKIPATTEISGPDNLRVTKVHVKGTWMLDGHDFMGETLDLVDARKEEYAVDPDTGEYVGHKPTSVIPTSMEEDVMRREFTFNTLMWRLSDLASGPDKAEIIDLTGCGVRDLEPDHPHHQVRLQVRLQAAPRREGRCQATGQGTETHPVEGIRGHQRHRIGES